MDYVLYHHGVKGQKWGVRRYQNSDGLLTPTGRQHFGSSSASTSKTSKDRSVAKKVETAMALTATVAIASVAYSKNHEAVNKVISSVGKTTMKTLREGSNRAVDTGKAYLVDGAKEIIKGAKEGIKEGLHEAPKNALKTAIKGGTLVATKKLLDATVGKEESAKIFQAANNKKVSSFWKVGQDGRDDD